MSDIDEVKVLNVQVFFDLSNVWKSKTIQDHGTHQISSDTNVRDWMDNYLTELGLSTFPTKCNFFVRETEFVIDKRRMNIAGPDLVFSDYGTAKYDHKFKITIKPMKNVDYRVRVEFRSKEQPERNLEYQIQAFDYVARPIEHFIRMNSLHDSECTFKIAALDLSPDNKKMRIGQLFDETGLSNDQSIVIKVTIKKYELKLVFPSGDGQSVHPDTTFIVKEMDLVKDVLDRYFVKEDLIIFDSDYTVKGFPLDADLIVRDMSFESGSSVATVCVMNAGPLEQLARVKWRLSVAKATLKDKKRKYHQADVEGSILESVYTSGYHCKKKNILALKRQLREFELDLSNTTKRYRKERVSKDKEINDAREEMDESKETFNKLDAKRMRLETVVVVSTAESVAMPECIICMDRIEKRGIVDCGQGHAEACINCYALLLANDQPCPTCRGKFNSVNVCITGTEK